MLVVLVDICTRASSLRLLMNPSCLVAFGRRHLACHRRASLIAVLELVTEAAVAVAVVSCCCRHYTLQR
jgi:hypothetical protein